MTTQPQEANALLPTLGNIHLGMPGTASFLESAHILMCAHIVTAATRLHHAGSQLTQAQHHNKSSRTSTGDESSYLSNKSQTIS